MFRALFEHPVNSWYGHPSSALFFVALAVVMVRWAPGGATRFARGAFFTLAGMSAAVALAYPLHSVWPWLSVIALVCALCLALFVQAGVAELRLSSELPLEWKRR